MHNSIRFRTPTLIFSTSIPLKMKFGELKELLEGKSGIPASIMKSNPSSTLLYQRWWHGMACHDALVCMFIVTWGFPEKEAIGEDTDLVTRVFGLKTGADTITVVVDELEGAAEAKKVGKKKSGGNDDGFGEEPGWGDDDDKVDESAFNDDGAGDGWGEGGDDEFGDGDDEAEKKVAAPPPLVRQTSYVVLSKDACNDQLPLVPLPFYDTFCDTSLCSNSYATRVD
jgi:hypothetical protein